MGLFQKKQSTTSSAPLYSIGLNKTLVIAGLGNVGKKYETTRHNLGFVCVDAFAAHHEFPDWVEKKDLKSIVTAHTMGDSRIILVKPTTFMNLSGEALQAVLHFYKVPISQLLVVHDELDLPFGQIRIRTGGSSAGNNGIESVSKHLGTEYGRVRIGIKNELAEKADTKDFVLAKFSKEESSHLGQLTKEVLNILGEYVYSGGQLNAETRNFIV